MQDSPNHSQNSHKTPDELWVRGLIRTCLENIAELLKLGIWLGWREPPLLTPSKVVSGKESSSGCGE